MPITIKELHIKINVDEKAEPQGQPSGAKSDNTAAIVAACVEEVMDILERQKER
ncbi:DUF5908 family protein [uncultured Tenacibaculum sp.]|uniref:DUF5908 family protein n=1 Tax=uncultured Tenacibaculum sp. TaxID=174713 RepID=UPI00261E04F7|nr:DUF5908 family protein [uncultured Tenacibaculum sp.]